MTASTVKSYLLFYGISFFFFKQKTAYEITRRDWSSDVCSSDLQLPSSVDPQAQQGQFGADPRVDPPKIQPFSPSPQFARWGSGDHSFVTATGASSSRLGTETIALPQSSALSGATAVPRLANSQQISLTGSVGGS